MLELGLELCRGPHANWSSVLGRATEDNVFATGFNHQGPSRMLPPWSLVSVSLRVASRGAGDVFWGRGWFLIQHTS